MSAGTIGSLDPQGPVAGTMADLWWLLLVLGAAIFVLVAVLLVGGLVRRRDPEGTELAAPVAADADAEAGRDEERRRLGRWLVGGGVALPLVVLIVVLGATVAAMRDVPTAVPRDALVIDVVGHQWWWEVRYPDDGIVTANELHLPVGRPVAFRLTSVDVIHSFWVPSLGGKLDLLPDGTNTLILEADEPGRHRTACAEFCGLQHARHGLEVVAEPPDAYAAWLAAQQAPAAEPTDERARRGRELFGTAGCAGCHAVRDAGNGRDAGGAAAPPGNGQDSGGEPVRGPDLTHLASRARLGAGSIDNSRAGLAEWVADPHTVKSGVEMPAAGLAPADLDALVTYLAGLR